MFRNDTCLQSRGFFSPYELWENALTMIDQNTGKMDSKGSSEENLLDQKKSLPPTKTSKQGEMSACDQLMSKIKRWLSKRVLICIIVFLYGILNLSLLIFIAAKQNELGHNLISTPQRSPPCPHHWIGYEGKCYYFSTESGNWSSSRRYCSLHHASLARIEKEEMDFVKRYKGKDKSWIGLQRVLHKDWTWTDGENAMMKVSGEGDCAYLDNNGEAIASGCHTKLPWICSMPDAYTTESQLYRQKNGVRQEK